MSFSVDAQAFLADLRKLESQLRKEAYLAIQETVQEAERSAKATTLFNDGIRNPHLRDTIQGQVTSSFTGEISANASYARFIENGTDARWIPASGGKLMRFEWKGVEMYRYRVWHPAVKARPFMEQAGEWGGKVLFDSLSAFTADAINRFNT